MGTVTLLTDFGSASPYPGEMKAVLLARCRAAVVDLTHEIPAHDVAAGAHVLAAAAVTFPTGTVHLAVVDPGVGTARRPLVVASGGHVFVGPDNGLLMVAAHRLGHPAAFIVDSGRFARRPLSPTFHGRDLFAPVAAALAAGLPPAQVGAPLPSPVELRASPAEREPGGVRGQILYCDTFGNAITNIPGDWLRTLPGSLRLHRGADSTLVRRVTTYGEGSAGEVLVLVGSSGMTEIAVNAGRAADVLALAPGQRVALTVAQHTAPQQRSPRDGGAHGTEPV
jgi:S-adenosylmethionine hydrolase